MSGRRTGTGVSAADRALFEAAVGAVEPIARRGDAERLSETPRPQRTETSPGPPPSPPPSPPSPAVKPPLLEPGGAAGVDARAVVRLRRGQMRPEARIDLHGQTLEQAHRAVAGFIERAASDGRRCVLVITGKGRIGQARGTIRSEFPRWLNQGRLRPRILAFAEAQPRDGGAGAYYLLLRRKRA